jgi:hypothetical protein
MQRAIGLPEPNSCEEVSAQRNRGPVCGWLRDHHVSGLGEPNPLLRCTYWPRDLKRGMQRLHEDDLTGHPKKGNLRVLSLSADCSAEQGQAFEVPVIAIDLAGTAALLPPSAGRVP